MVYHPPPGSNGTQGHAWANVGFLGWAGSLTGFSEQRMAIHEIGVYCEFAAASECSYVAGTPIF